LGPHSLPPLPFKPRLFTASPSKSDFVPTDPSPPLVKNKLTPDQEAYYENRRWYQKHREEFLKDPNLLYKPVAIENQKVTVLDDFLGRDQYLNAHPRAYYTFVGDEDWASKQLVDSPTPLYNRALVPSPLFGKYFVPSSTVLKSYFYGSENCPYLELGVSLSKDSSMVLPVTFYVDTGATSVFLEDETINALGLELKERGQVYIGGVEISVQRSAYHYSNVNLLGTSFLYHGDLRLNYFADEISWKFVDPQHRPPKKVQRLQN